MYIIRIGFHNNIFIKEKVSTNSEPTTKKPSTIYTNEQKNIHAYFKTFIHTLFKLNEKM